MFLAPLAALQDLAPVRQPSTCWCVWSVSDAGTHMQLVLILTIVVATTLSLQASSDAGGTLSGWRLFATLAGGVGVVVGAWVLQRWDRIRIGLGDGELPTSCRPRTHGLHLGIYVTYVVAAYTWLDYPGLIKSWTSGRHVVLVDELLQLAPAILPLFGSWMVLSEAAGQRPAERRCPIRTRAMDALSRARHDLLLPLAPILMLITVRDALHLILPDRADQLEGPLLLACLLGIAVFLPKLLRLIWPTNPLPANHLRRQLEIVLRRAGLTISEILVWQTNHRIVNAATTGVLPSCRYLLLSDGLLERLEAPQLTAIVAHEAGHLRHRHPAILLLSLSIPLFSLLILHNVLDQAGVGSAVGIYGSLFLFVFWMGVHSRLARLLEHQADVDACHLLASQSQLQPETVDQYGQALQATAVGGHAADWLHPSVASRLAVLHYLLQHPNHELEFQRHVRCANRMLAVLALLLLGVWAFGA